MASCCGPDNTCTCAVEAGDGITVTGTGASSNPFVVSATSVPVVTDSSIAAALSLPGSESLAVLEQRYAPASNVKYFGAVGDAITDDTVSFNAWLDHLESSGMEGWIPPGMYRLTSSLLRRDRGAPFKIRGAGSRQSYLIADYVAAGAGIVDLSNDNTTSYSTGGHHVSGIGFLGRGTAGDPIGLLMLNAFEAEVEDIDAPAAGSGGVPVWSGNPTGQPLANSVTVVTNDNNSKWRNIRGQGGWQPLAFDLAGATASFTSGSNIVTASSGVFTAAMSGQTIFFASGSDTGSNAIWSAVFTYTDSTHGTLSVNAPSTNSGVRMSVGYIKGAITSGANSLVLSSVVGLSADYVGMQVHVIGASVKTDASSATGVLSTRITAVNVGTKTLTLADNATTTVSAAVVLFCPNVFIGSFQGDPVGRQTNHSWWDNLHSEGFACTGLLANRIEFLNIDNLKIHGAPYSSAVDWSQCYYSAVFSEVKLLSIDKVQATYSVLGPRFHISGSRGLLSIENCEITTLLKDTSPFLIATASDNFKFVYGRVWLTYDLTGFNEDTFSLVNTPKKKFVVSSSPSYLRSNNGKATKTPGTVAQGITGQNGQVSINDDAVAVVKPPNTFGFFSIASDASEVYSLFHYRTSEHASGALLKSIGSGTSVDVRATDTTTLAGTTGTDGRVTIANNTSGFIQVENRRGFTVNVAFIASPFGGPS